MKTFLKTLNYFPAIFFVAAVLLVSFSSPVALAQGGGSSMGLDVVDGYSPPARDLPSTILIIVNYVLVIVGVVALAYLIYGGFLYITSHGDTSQVDSAKNTIVYAVIGIIVIGVAAAVVNFVVGAVTNS
jgi:TRAP-type C4-dicarboxylate transport system permease small subunit